MFAEIAPWTPVNMVFLGPERSMPEINTETTIHPKVLSRINCDLKASTLAERIDRKSGGAEKQLGSKIRWWGPPTGNV